MDSRVHLAGEPTGAYAAPETGATDGSQKGGGLMNRDQLLKRLTAHIDEAARQRMYGNIDIEFRAGEPVFIRKTQQEKLDETENRHGQRVERY